MGGVHTISPECFLAIFRGTKPAGDERRNALPRASASTAEAAVIERFLHEVRHLGSERVGLILDPEIGNLRRSEPFGQPGLALLDRRAREMGIPVVHPRRALAEYSLATGLDMRVGPYDAHWNPHANCVIAHEILDTLPGGPGSMRTPVARCARSGQS